MKAVLINGSTPDEVKKDAEGMEIAYNLGRNMSWIMKALNKMPAPADSLGNPI